MTETHSTDGSPRSEHRERRTPEESGEVLAPLAANLLEFGLRDPNISKGLALEIQELARKLVSEATRLEGKK